MGSDAFVTKFNPAGSALVYSTYLGGSGGDSANGIAVDNSGDAYVTGNTQSTNFPTTPGAFQTTCGGDCVYPDAFLTKLPLVPVVTLSPTNLNFGNQTVGITSTPQVVTLTNTGNINLTITSIQVTGTNSGDFAQTNNCPSRLNPGANCTIRVKFHPTTKGVSHGAVSVKDNAPGSPQKVPLTGTGTYVQLLPTTLNFGTQPVGTTITLTNKGNSTVTITGISTTGTDARDFAETNTCGKSVASGASCFIKVTFKPLVKGKRTANVSVYDNGGGSPQEVGLIGTGT
jgi:hypothetical protein